MKALQGEQSFQETRMAHIDRGDEPEKVALKYRKSNDRMIKIVQTYSTDEGFDLMQYLTKMAHNISF